MKYRLETKVQVSLAVRKQTWCIKFEQARVENIGGGNSMRGCFWCLVLGIFDLLVDHDLDLKGVACSTRK